MQAVLETLETDHGNNIVSTALSLIVLSRNGKIEGCQFSDFSLISDFLRIKELGIKFLKYSQNMDKISIVSKDRLDSGKGLDNPSLNTVSTHLNQFRLSSD